MEEVRPPAKVPVHWWENTKTWPSGHQQIKCLMADKGLEVGRSLAGGVIEGKLLILPAALAAKWE